MNEQAIKDLLYKLADDELILGHRNSEWTGFGPILEEDIAFANLALHARSEGIPVGKALHLPVDEGGSDPAAVAQRAAQPFAGSQRFHRGRLLDVGQCNDTYSAVQVALALANAFNCGVNDLPLSVILSWYEQKAVAILLTLRHLGIQDIRLGPSLPAFITPNVLDEPRLWREIGFPRRGRPNAR